MNRLTTLGVLLVALLLPTQVSGQDQWTWSPLVADNDGRSLESSRATAPLRPRFRCQFNKKVTDDQQSRFDIAEDLRSSAKSVATNVGGEGIGVMFAVAGRFQDQPIVVNYDIGVFPAQGSAATIVVKSGNAYDRILKVLEATSPEYRSGRMKMPNPRLVVPLIQPAPAEVARAVLDGAELLYRKRPEQNEPDCALPPAPKPAKITPVAPKSGTVKTKWSWSVSDVVLEVLKEDDNGNKHLATIEQSVATLALRERVNSEGTTQKQRLSYQDRQLDDDLLSVGKTLDPTVKSYVLRNAEFKVGGASYAIQWLRRAKPGAREEDFHAILSREEDPSRVVVYVTGPSADVRHKILADAEALYGKRPASLDCTGDSNAKDSPRYAACFGGQ